MEGNGSDAVQSPLLMEGPKDPFAVPSPEVMREIGRRQDEQAKEIAEKRRRKQLQQQDVVEGKKKHEDDDIERRDGAARLIQKNYRGYRARRALMGFGLDPGTRWMELLKDAKYLNSTQPMSKRERTVSNPGASPVRERWKRLNTIAARAGDDDTSSEDDEDVESGDAKEREEARQRKQRDKMQREKYAKTMGIDYFLEMVDQKHRYGSNLRRYHLEWKKSDTDENFFYWLDFGEGKDLDLEDRPRSRLDYECVRYLSREERQRYLVHIENGLFCWSKNDKPITTSLEFKDSIDGIVPIDDDTPTWREVTTGEAPPPAPLASSSSSLSSIGAGSQEDSSKYVNTDLHDAKGLAKLQHVNVDSLKNNMLRKTTKKNTWIFVADTSFRLYIGIKQSGAFQHSSFLRGARVAAAGLMKIKNGQLRKISPLSGHYAPPLKNFEEFLKSLKEANADLSRLNVSRSYAVLLGLEGYLGAKRHAKTGVQGVKDIFEPEKKREREEAAKDGSESAKREREVLEEQEKERRRRSLSYRFMKKLGLDKDKDEKVKVKEKAAR